jgi:hypothetical protein
MGVSRETKIAFHISAGTAYFEGFTEPNQPTVPHFKTIPAACEQIGNVPSIQNVESPEETLGYLLTAGRKFPQS